MISMSAVVLRMWAGIQRDLERGARSKLTPFSPSSALPWWKQTCRPVWFCSERVASRSGSECLLCVLSVCLSKNTAEPPINIFPSDFNLFFFCLSFYVSEKFLHARVNRSIVVSVKKKLLILFYMKRESFSFLNKKVMLRTSSHLKKFRWPWFFNAWFSIISLFSGFYCFTFFVRCVLVSVIRFRKCIHSGKFFNRNYHQIYFEFLRQFSFHPKRKENQLCLEQKSVFVLNVWSFVS